MCWIFLSTSLVCVINTITQISLVTVSSTSSYMCWNVSDDPGASLRSLFPPLQFKSQQWVLSEHKTKFSQSAWPAAPGYIISEKSVLISTCWDTLRCYFKLQGLWGPKDFFSCWRILVPLSQKWHLSLISLKPYFTRGVKMTALRQVNVNLVLTGLQLP